MVFAGACGGPSVVVSRTSSLPVMDPPAPAAEPAPAQAVQAEARAAEPVPAAVSLAPPEPVVAPPDLAAWAREVVQRDLPPSEEPAVSDDYNELVSPFDEKIIEEIAQDQSRELAELALAVHSAQPPPVPLPLPAEPGSPVPAPEAVPADIPPAISYDIPIEFNKQVLAYVELFQTVRRASFEVGLVRSRIYEERMKRILAEEGVPLDLYYLCLIESAYQPKAYSRAHAMGPWQFIESTGRLYGLNRDWWMDERRDPDKSTRAAARHLRDLYRETGSWPLSLAAYNAGLGYVKRMVAKHGTTDFWSLKLVAQTKNYVPAFMAATIISKEPEKYGFILDYQPPLDYERVTVDQCTSLEVIAECAGTTVDEIRALNPEILRWCTPPVAGGYEIAVPRGSSARFNERYAQIPKDRKLSWSRHQIVAGDTLSGISLKFGTPMDAIAQVNNLKLTSLLRVGDYLLIPIPGSTTPPPESETRRVAALVTPSTQAGAGTKLSYRVRPGDNLWLIAQRHRVSVEELKSWNGSLEGELLHTGDLLTVWSRQPIPELTASREVKPMASGSYQVKRGDTLWSIARRFATDVENLCRLNGFPSSRPLMPGDTISIPGNSM
jgi:membrane-bound lytic murein transglycosylase D